MVRNSAIVLMQILYNNVRSIPFQVFAESKRNVMEDSNHPLGMMVLEMQDTVADHGSINEASVRMLMAADDMAVMSHSMQRRVLGQLITSADALVAEVGETALVVTGQWVISIHGDNFNDCVDTLLKYRNAVAVQLGATVTGALTNPVTGNTGALRGVALRRERRMRLRNWVGTACWTVAGALMGAALGVAGCVLFGG